MIDWNSIHYGKISKQEIEKYIVSQDWQLLRKHLLGKSLEYKYKMLCNWLDKNAYVREVQVQVTNYINALKRGGLIKGE